MLTVEAKRGDRARLTREGLDEDELERRPVEAERGRAE
jgi:hypothetical protein